MKKSIYDSLKVDRTKKYDSRHETSDDKLFHHGNHKHNSHGNPPGKLIKKEKELF